ncbi:MAG TPA: dihydropteroate synthase-like protein [candidate division Zixibacteria bacterium]|nr:dihydropteroate synthase-like protein [candidate division Zixibacteria bacterium]
MEKDSPIRKLKVLALTGRAAESIIRANIPKNVLVKVLPIDVAAFITREFILENITKNEAMKYDLILVPGFVQGDLTELKNILGVPVVKGPRYASDIKLALKELTLSEFSSKYSADKFIQTKKYSETKDLLNYGFNSPLEKQKSEFTLGLENQFLVGLDRPALVMAEIIDAPKMTIDQIKDRVKYFLKYGANIIDIGVIAKSPQPKKIFKIISELQKLKEIHHFIISIDTLNVEEIVAAIEAKVDLILSIDHGNINDLIDKIPNETGIVFLPTNIKDGYMPKAPEERVKSLIKLRDKLQKAGFTKLFADPIIEMPIYPGFASSLESYILFRKKDQRTPMMTCIGNVTEFIEADPIGINVLFGCLAVELGIQLLLMTDYSVKCRGGIKEIVKARDLAFAAKQRKAPPKGHGINILMAKSKTDLELEIPIHKDLEIIDLKFADANLYSMDYEFDPKGSFTIWIDYYKQKIYVVHMSINSKKPDLLFISSNARMIIEEIQKRGLLSKLDHAIYMGRELERAEICLYLGKTYIQNEQAFKESELY